MVVYTSQRAVVVRTEHFCSYGGTESRQTNKIYHRASDILYFPASGEQGRQYLTYRRLRDAMREKPAMRAESTSAEGTTAPATRKEQNEVHGSA